jgi:hypothetical protein
MSHDLADKVTSYLRHLENRDWVGARAMCTETATVWHNDGKGEQTIDENVAGMAGQVASIESMHYDITRQFSRPGEILQQHAVKVATKDGTRGEVHAAAYFRFVDGLIDRIEEYASFLPAPEA